MQLIEFTLMSGKLTDWFLPIYSSYAWINSGAVHESNGIKAEITAVFTINPAEVLYRGAFDGRLKDLV
jgi:hypothetical protein